MRGPVLTRSQRVLTTVTVNSQQEPDQSWVAKCPKAGGRPVFDDVTELGATREEAEAAALAAGGWQELTSLGAVP